VSSNTDALLGWLRCPAGNKCLLTGDTEHRQQFRHDEVLQCPSGNKCPLLGDEEHKAKYSH